MFSSWISPVSIGSRLTYISPEVVLPVIVLNETLDENETVLVSTDDGYAFRAWCCHLYDCNTGMVKFIKELERAVNVHNERKYCVSSKTSDVCYGHDFLKRITSVQR